MYDHGALAVLSLDGYMSAEIASDALSAGDKVRVIRADGSEIPGAVNSAANGKAEILVTDNGPAAGENVEILDAEGNSLGSAELAIHSPLRVSGITGTVSAVRVQENQKVYASTTIFNLTDTAYAAAYQTLLEERSALEDTMVELMTLYSTGVVRAPYDGSVTAVLYDSAEEYEDEISLLTVSPDRQMNVTINVDESNILSLELGQTAQITVSSIGDTVFSGTVTEINKTASSASGVTRYSAVVTLDKTPEMLQGMSARVVVRISGVDNAVIIPVEALHQTSSTSYVYTSFDEETQEFGGMVNVEVGITNSSYAEILSGLQEGDTVWYTETENSFFSNMGFAGGSFPGGSGSGSMPSMPSGGDFSGGFPGGSGSGGFPGVIYYNSGTDDQGNVTWTQSWGVNRGDRVVFAFDADLAWMIYIGHEDLPEPTPEPTPVPSPEPGQGGMPGGGTAAAPSGGGMPAAGMPAGQTEEESLFSTAGTTILSVTPQDTVSVTITVDELDILSVQPGQEVSVTIDALPGQSFRGDITAIDTTAANDGGNTKYAVEITLDRTEKMLGGMNASAKITLLTKDHILTIPTEALSEGETGTVVYTGYDVSTETLLSPVVVETGLSDGQRTEILSGLAEGEIVWYAYYDTLPGA